MHNSIGDKMEKSFWMSEYDVKIANAEFLNNLEVLIIGGGITGIMTAYELSKSNIKVAIATADKIGTHTSVRTIVSFEETRFFPVQLLTPKRLSYF